MSNHKAVVSIKFPRPVKGSELIEVVKTLIGEGDRYAPSFIHQRHFDNGDVFVIGQHSKYPYEQILVTPTRESDGIRPDETYRTVEVMDTSWPGPIFMIGYDDDSVVHAVRKFAESLEGYFVNSTNTSAPSVWPQEVKVCAICEKIVWPVETSFYCENDGTNPPTKLVRVAPIVE